MRELRVSEGGSGGPGLLLLHGLGATGDVWAAWRPGLAQRWRGRWVAPDLPGHGGSPGLPEYTFDAFAAAVAAFVDPDGGTVVIGHSLGGVVGLALAATAPVRAVIGLGIKVEWTPDELARASALAQRPVAWFDTRHAAAARFLRVSGLDGLVPPDSAAVDAGLVEQDGRWRLAMDPRAFGVGAPDMARRLADASGAVLLARGEHDAMNTDGQLARLGAPTVTLPGLGHNAHVENPERTLSLLDHI
jgi:pimeloyl-ACP methyl ester carboxylesterase